MWKNWQRILRRKPALPLGDWLMHVCEEHTHDSGSPAAMGWQVVADAKSGKNLDRPGLKKMMTVVALLASIAKLEREKIRERTLAGLARAGE